MKRIISFLLVTVFSIGLITAQQTDSVQQTASQTVVVTEWEDTPASPPAHSSHLNFGYEQSEFEQIFGKSATVIIIVSLLLSLGLPLFIVFIAFYFQYKNRKAKYKLVEQALATGQPLPEDFLNGGRNKDLQSKGIRNFFTGLGLFILLWALTTSFAIGSIGILVMCIGLGEIVVARTSKPKENK